MPVITQPINTAIPSAGAGKVTPVAQVLQPGAMVDAQVLATRANLVKIAVTGMLLEVMSEVQLQPGTALKLQVTQTADGIRLAVVDKQLPDQAARTVTTTGIAPQATTANAATSNSSATSSAATTTRVVAPSLQPDQTPVRAATGEPAAVLQASAVSQAARAAAPVQASLSSLFANLPVIVASQAAPPDVKAAAAQLLAARPPMTENLNATDVRNAFKASGVLLEASLAKGIPAGTSAATPTGVPDLKAALTVFRQLVANWSASEGKPAQPAPALPQNSGVQQSQTMPLPLIVTDRPGAVLPQAATTLSKPADASIKAALTPNDAAASDSAEPLMAARTIRDQQGAALTKPAGAIAPDNDETLVKPSMPALLQVAVRASAEPAPPFRGSAPSVQPIVAPSIDLDMPAPHLAAQLLDQADGALAQQTLLQVASLPERLDAASVAQSQQRWAFEIPFATQQGTAVAQFEIAEDDSNGMAESGAPKRVWRARFTLDIETTGPVHALVSLVGDKTTVRMWAERADTAAQLRAGTQALDSALKLADLQPGDIVVQDGQPPKRTPARAGHFLDRAT
jgi:hypothetical protein